MAFPSKGPSINEDRFSKETIISINIAITAAVDVRINEAMRMSGFAAFRQRRPTRFYHHFRHPYLHTPPPEHHAPSSKTFVPAHSVQIPPTNPSLPTLSSFVVCNVLHVSLHVLPPNFVQQISLLQSNLYALLPTYFAGNPSYHPKVGNLQIHSTFEVGESSAHSNPSVQASPSGIAGTIEATSGTTSNTPNHSLHITLPMYYENPIISSPTLTSSNVTNTVVQSTGYFSGENSNGNNYFLMVSFSENGP
ncbi:kirola-like [Cucumis melo var. makuwa]|uniref:Kirola-like n=1 Tax=Cucumis melo var. makuwa TaxID=1194695 RepID=A0A5D3BCQ1_CUCMM|nr:kirola-like [Cucumis melo var. makuwa]